MKILFTLKASPQILSSKGAFLFVDIFGKCLDISWIFKVNMAKSKIKTESLFHH